MFPLRCAARSFLRNGGTNTPFSSRQIKTYTSEFSFKNRFINEVPRFLRNNSVVVMKNCVAQVEFVVAFRIRRGVQVLSLYGRLWDEIPILKYLRKLKKTVLRSMLKRVMVAAVAFKFDWDTNRIPDEELYCLAEEFDICNVLLKSENKSDETKNDNTKKDPEKKSSCTKDISENYGELVEQGWVRFIEKDDMSVWKKEVAKGQHTYKIYAKYSDVTALDFFELYIDLDNRTKWDDHAVSLKKIDSEVSSNSDVIYWETKWPTPFSNRDYVFNRRWMIDSVKKVMVIKSKSATHPSLPVVNGKSRVKEYWSYVVIKPFTEFNEPGLEFCLTYFDNHGAHLPSSLTLWVTVNGLPEYISRLRDEALKLKAKRDSTIPVIVPIIPETTVDIDETEEPKQDDEEIKKKPVEKKSEPPRKPPDDDGCDPLAIFLFTIMERIKESLIKTKIELERRAAIAQKNIESSFR